ncbi:hypothetical protein LPJ59_000417 [Coemansia sp. RSA 2399]|nr:hypothetical protein LPJ59_000417 [Coemansia sp. RSA 2399]
MSYIPRPTASASASASAFAVGRPDEIRSVSSSHTNNPADIAHLFATPLLPTANNNNGPNSLVKIPSSTRASVAKAFSDDSSLPTAPPVPDILNMGSASIASSTTTAQYVGTTAPAARTHRRTVSAGDELKMAIAARASGTVTPGTMQAAGVATQSHTLNGLGNNIGQERSRPRLGLSSLRLAWSHARETRHGRASDAAQASQWAAEEVGALASVSAQYWRSGCAVDFSAVSSEMGRPVGEVRDMLEYMLQGYVRFGGGAFWAGERPELIVGWAAREFPRSPSLNPPAHALPGSTLTRNSSRLDACLAVLRCRPHSAAYLDAYSADRLGSIPSAQNVVGDFREGMRIHDVDTLSLAQRQPLASNSATQHKDPDLADIVEDGGSISSTSRNATAASTQGGSATDQQRQHPESHTSPNVHSGTQKQTVSAPTDSKSDHDSEAASHWDFRPGVSNVPLFTGGLRNHQALNTLSRESRTRRARRGSFRAEPSLTAVLDGRPPQNPTVEPSASFTFALSPATTTAAQAMVVKVDKGTSPVEPAGFLATRQRAHTVAHMDVAVQATNPTRLSRDSGNVDVSELRLPGASIIDDADPLQPRLGTSQPDSELDAHFRDIGPEIRQKVRRFVAQFVSDFPSDFQQRVKALQAGKDGLCMTIDNFPDFEYNSDAFTKAIETVYRYVGGSVIYTCNMFFHVQLLHTIRAHRIPVTEDNWLRVNEFATKVLNKKIEDAQFVVLEEYTKSKSSRNSSSSQRAVNGNVVYKEDSPPQSLLPSISGSRYDSIVGNEHLSPFDLAFYMDKLAHSHVQFFLQNHSDEIMKRARSSSYRPMPVALYVDEDKMQKFDVDIRNLLIAFIWEDMPTSTLESKEITLLRALELFNGEIADRCSFRLGNMFQLMHKTKNEDGPSDQDKIIADVSTVKEMPTGGLAQALGKSFARQYFDEDKDRFLEAMMHNHPFRPIERDELREWMVRESSPFGDDIDYRLNTRLYKYLRRLRIRPSDKQWMQASGAATLSMIRRVKNAIFDKGYVEHIDIDACSQRFKDIVRDARNSSDGSPSSRSDAQSRSEDPNKLRLSAFGKVPGWVSLLTDSRSTDSGSPKDTTGVSSRAPARFIGTPHNRSSIHGVKVDDEQAQKTTTANEETSTRQRSPAVNGKERTQVVSQPPLATNTISAAHQRPKGNGMQPAGPVDTAKDSELVDRSQLKGNISLPGLIHHYTVPMPNGSYQHLSQPVPIPHMQLPFFPLDIHQHMPVMYPTAPPPPLHPIVQGNGQANMEAVMRKFDEMQEMFRQMQAEKR